MRIYKSIIFTFVISLVFNMSSCKRVEKDGELFLEHENSILKESDDKLSETRLINQNSKYHITSRISELQSLDNKNEENTKTDEEVNISMKVFEKKQETLSASIQETFNSNITSATNEVSSSSVTTEPYSYIETTCTEETTVLTEEMACHQGSAEAYRISPLGNSGMEWLYSRYGGEVAAQNAAVQWADAYLIQHIEEGGEWVAYTVYPLAWSDDSFRSCTVNFY